MTKAATLEVEIGAKIDKFEKSLGKVRKDLKGMETRLGGVSRGASKATTAFSGMAKKLIAVGIAYFGARGIFKMAKSFLDVAITVEQYEIRLKTLLGSQQKATEAMREFQGIAAKLPYTLEQVIESGIRLTTIKVPFKDWLTPIADVAAAFGLDLPTATDQFARAMSAGLGAADWFREKGISAMIRDFAKLKYGIEDVSKVGTTKLTEVMFEWAKTFKGSTEDMSKTWKGIVSMLQDKWFQFRDTVMKAGVFEILRGGLASFDEKIGEFIKTGKLELWAKDTAIAVIGAFSVIVKGVEGLMFSFYTLKAAIYGAITDLTVQMRAYIEKLIIGFGLLEKLGVPVKGILSDLVTEWANLVAEESRLNETIEETTDKMAGILTSFDKLKELLNRTKEAIKDTKDEIGGLTEKAGEFGVKIEESTLPAVRRFDDILKEALPSMDSYTFALEGMTEAQKEFTEIALGELATMEAGLKGFVNAVLNTLERWAIGEIIVKVLKSAIPFPFNLLAVAGAIASVKAIFAGIKGLKEGGVVMQEGIYRLHPKEMVLPIEKAPQMMREMASPGSPTGFSPTINLNIYARTLDRDTVDRASEMIYDAIERQGRRRG